MEQFAVRAGDGAREIGDELFQVSAAGRGFQVNQKERLSLGRPHLFGQPGSAESGFQSAR